MDYFAIGQQAEALKQTCETVLNSTNFPGPPSGEVVGQANSIIKAAKAAKSNDAIITSLPDSPNTWDGIMAAMAAINAAAD